jgi:hypothetical protein
LVSRFHNDLMMETRRPTASIVQSTPVPQPIRGGILRGSNERERMPVAASTRMKGNAVRTKDFNTAILSFPPVCVFFH